MNYKKLIFLSLWPIAILSSDSDDSNPSTKKGLSLGQGSQLINADSLGQVSLAARVDITELVMREHDETFLSMLGIIQKLIGRVESLQLEQHELKKRLSALESNGEISKP